jgi:hypothetical protein
MNCKRVSAFVLAVSAMTFAARADDGEFYAKELKLCAQMRGSEARLVCYDELAIMAMTTTSGEATVAPPVPVWSSASTTSTSTSSSTPTVRVKSQAQRDGSSAPARTRSKRRSP